MRVSAVLFLSLTSLAFLSGCGDYTSITRAAREEFYAGQYTEAAKILEEGAHEDGVDQLLYLLDRATALHQAGDYEASNKDFHLADKLAEIKDYTSLSTEAATLFTNDRIVQYKGEDFEKVLISQYLAINYLMLGKHEDALVEARRVNHKLHLMITEGKRRYKLNPFASYLAALMYEDQKEWNDAYVDYRAVHKLAPDFPYLGEDLYRLAWINGITEDAERWANEYRLSADHRKQIRQTAKQNEIVVIVENGRSPEKQPHPMWQALPQYVPRYNASSYADVIVNDDVLGRSHTLFNVEATAIANLDEKYAGLLAKRIGGVVAKEVVAHEVGRRTDPVVGAILRMGLHAIDQADLRSWLTLPRDFQVFRLRIADPKATYTVKIRPKTSLGGDANVPTKGLEKVVHFDPKKPGQKIVFHVRIL